MTTAEATFAPVRSQTAFEETLERLGNAIKLGLLQPGERLPAERELCAMMGISRSTLRQALTALVQSGHLRAVRGRGGGTFVSEQPPPAPKPSKRVLGAWRAVCDERLAVEVGIAYLAAERAGGRDELLEPLDAFVAQLDDELEDFDAYRKTDVRLHVALAELTGNPRLVVAATEAQGAMTDLIAHIAHPPEVLAVSNGQHARLLAAIRRGEGPRAMQIMAEHLRGTEHVLAALLPGP